MPLGKIVTVEGASDLGKTLVMRDWIARLSSGRGIPGTTKNISGPVGAVYVAYEDDFDDTIIPRLIKAGADFSRIRLIGYVNDGDSSMPFAVNLPTHLDLLESAVDQVQAKLIIIDPVTSAFAGKVDLNQSGDVRKGLAPLIEFAHSKGVTVANIRHHRKDRDGGFKEKGVGTMAFQEVARVGIAFEEDPNDDTEESRLLVHFKHNLTQGARALKYRVVGDKDGMAFVDWLGESALTNRQILDRVPAMGGLRQDIASLFNGDECQPVENIVGTLGDRGYEQTNIRMTLSRMVKDRQLEQRVRGVYCAA